MSWWRIFARFRRERRKHVHRADWLRFAGDDILDRIMAQPVTDRFHAKQGRSTGRWIMHHQGASLAVYLKRHYRLPWWQRLLAFLFPGCGWSPALHEWRNLQWARKRGIPVPDPVAAGEFRGPWFRLESFLAIAELKGMRPLHELIPQAQRTLPPHQFDAWKRNLIREMARVVRLLHRAQRYHKDLYLCHFFVPETALHMTGSLEGQVYLIDLHRLAKHRLTGWRWRCKDLAQLLYSADVPGIDDRDGLRFLQAYLGRAKLRFFDRWLRRAVLAKANRYRKHNVKASLVARRLSTRRLGASPVGKPGADAAEPRRRAQAG
jgi:heptose I phosphotransferase